MVFKWLGLAALLFFLSGCAIFGPAKIEVSDVSVLEAKVSQLSAGDLNFACICDQSTTETTTPAFLVLRNSGGEPDRLVKVETSQAVKVELRQGNGKSDLTSAKPVQSVDVPAFGRIEFNNGNYYMILTGLKEDIRSGETIVLTLYFEKSGIIHVEALVKPR